MFHVEHGPPPVQTPAQLTCSHPRSPWLPTALASDSWRDILNLTDQPSGSPCCDEDVIAAGQTERVGVGAQRPQGGDAVELLHHLPALEILDDGNGQCPPPLHPRCPTRPGRRLGDGELGGARGQPERTRDVWPRSRKPGPRFPAPTPASDRALVAVEQGPSITPVLTTGHQTAVVPPWCLGVASDNGDEEAEADQARVGSIHIHPDGIAIALRVTAAVVTSSPQKGGSATERVRTPGRIASSGVGWSLSRPWPSQSRELSQRSGDVSKG